MTGVSNAKDRSGLILVALFLFCLLAAPLIFYGLVSMGAAGLFDFLADRFWLIIAILIAAVLAVWVPILWLGARMDRKHLEAEKAQRKLAESPTNG